MRTTVAINDELLAAAKVRAAAAHQTLGEFLEDSIRQRLKAEPCERGPIHIPVIHGTGGIRPGVDFTSNAALLEAMDDRP